MHNTLGGLVDFPVDHSERKGKGPGGRRGEKKCGWKDVILRGGEGDDVERNLDTVGRFDEAGKRLENSLSLSPLRRVK